MSMAQIRFLANEAGKVEGLAYAGFETFRGSPYVSCARETGQNSRDAASGEGPVRVSFNLLELDREAVPFADALQHSISCCLSEPIDDKTKQHLKRALKTVSSAKIKVLAISDENTTGLCGPTTDPTSVFTALVKGDGVTNKHNVTSAGSFGIGKNAAYAVSDLQTVIYSTCYEDINSGELKFAAQGRLRLISHRDGPTKYSAEGYWGGPNFTAIESKGSVPQWMARDVVGTSIFSIGFREEDHWASRMTLSLVANFFLAIDRQEIEFTVDGTRISSSSIDCVLDSEGLRNIAEQADQLAELERARRLLDCVRSEAAAHHTITVSGLGDFTLHLLVKEGLPREVHVLRNGIYITDNFTKFSQPLRQFPRTREFTAVLEPARTSEGEMPSALLKLLENPAHDAFEPDRIVDEQDRLQARKQIKELINKVRGVIRSVAKIDDVSRSQLDELSHLFADTGVTQGQNKADEDDPDRFRYGEAKKGNRDQDKKGVNGKGPGIRKGDRPGTKSKGTGKGKSSGKEGGTQQAMPLEAVRSILPDHNDTKKRSIFFTPGSDGEMELAIAASGLSGDVELAVSETSIGSLGGGRVRLKAKAGERIAMTIAFSEPFDGPIELEAVSAQAPTR